MIKKVIVTEQQIIQSKTYLEATELTRETSFDWNRNHMINHYSNLLTIAKVKGLNYVLNIYHVKESEFKIRLLKELVCFNLVFS